MYYFEGGKKVLSIKPDGSNTYPTVAGIADVKTDANNKNMDRS
jgi:hypothetical protein